MSLDHEQQLQIVGERQRWIDDQIKLVNRIEENLVAVAEMTEDDFIKKYANNNHKFTEVPLDIRDILPAYFGALREADLLEDQTDLQTESQRLKLTDLARAQKIVVVDGKTTYGIHVVGGSS